VFFQILPPDFKRAEHGDGRLIGSQAPINEFQVRHGRFRAARSEAAT